VIAPSVLLLDEPFANLDKSLKMETAEFIRQTQKQFGITTISVTHNLEEAFAMSDKIGIMLDGELIQFDLVKQLYFSPASYEVAKFLGPVNIIPRQLFALFGIEDSVPTGIQSVYARAEAVLIKKSAFIRQVFYAVSGGHSQYMKGFDEELFKKQSQKLWSSGIT